MKKKDLLSLNLLLVKNKSARWKSRVDCKKKGVKRIGGIESMQRLL